MNLRDYQAKTYSQFGEDGIVAELIARLDPPKYFCEIGVATGLECNCRLLAESGVWAGRFIEAREDCFLCLVGMHKDRLDYIWCINSFVTIETLPEDLAGISPDHFGLLSIDVDGNDSYLWEGICGEYSALRLKPWIVVIEVNHHIESGKFWRMPYVEDWCWDGHRLDYGTSLAFMNELAGKMGYAHVGTTTEGVNSFYVRSDLVGKLGE